MWSKLKHLLTGKTEDSETEDSETQTKNKENPEEIQTEDKENPEDEAENIVPSNHSCPLEDDNHDNDEEHTIMKVECLPKHGERFLKEKALARRLRSYAYFKGFSICKGTIFAYYL